MSLTIEEKIKRISDLGKIVCFDDSPTEMLHKTLVTFKLNTHVSELNDFPYSKFSYPEIIVKINQAKIIPAVLYRHESRHIFLNRNQKLVSKLIGTSMLVIPILFLGLAIYTKYWLFLIGMPTFLVGAFVSNPWARKTRQMIILLSIMGIIIGILFHWQSSIIFTGLISSIVLALFSREYINSCTIAKILYSELFFCLAYQIKILLLKDTETNEIHSIRS